MLELNPLSDILVSEIALGALLLLLSLLIVFYIFKTKKFNLFFYGFSLIALWNFLEFLDEFFVKNDSREIVFNIGGRVILIIGLIVLVFTMKKFEVSKNEK